MIHRVGIWAALLILATAVGSQAVAAPIPHYAHIFVIIEENHTTDEIIGNPAAPNLTKLSKQYGFASNYYAIRHPSEPNYIALVGGDTFGIADDDAFYCKPGSTEFGCEKSGRAGYVDHTVTGLSLVDQLAEKGLSWKGYFESLPEPGSLAYRWPSPKEPIVGKPDSLYAVKHNGFMTFKSVQSAPDRAKRIVGFDVLEQDIKAGTLPSFAHIVPNQCNDMHGLKGHDVPADCTGKQSAGLIARADRLAAHIVDEILASPMWKGPANDAIVITFDENDDESASPRPDGCCGSRAGDPTNPGGGWIPTIVITNHGPRGLADTTPNNHFSLLRTIEDALGLKGHLRHAGDESKGVVPMTRLFAVARS
jgi:phospholipase C